MLNKIRRLINFKKLGADMPDGIVLLELIDMRYKLYDLNSD